MEEVVRWLASWVSAENGGNNGGGGGHKSGGGGTTNKESSCSTISCGRGGGDYIDYWRMGPAGSFVRLAGVSGAMAIGFGAYGAHVFRDQPDIPRQRVLAFDTGSRYHLLHSVALLCTPLAKYPIVTGLLFAIGTALFSGTCYYYALTGRDEVRRFTPYGGMILILAWLSLVA